MPPLRFREVRRFLRARGWWVSGQEGSHEHWEHGTKLGKPTVAGHDSDYVHPKTLQSILRQAGESMEDLMDFL